QRNSGIQIEVYGSMMTDNERKEERLCFEEVSIKNSSFQSNEVELFEDYALQVDGHYGQESVSASAPTLTFELTCNFNSLRDEEISKTVENREDTRLTFVVVVFVFCFDF
ncbi:hypothetical protein RFI_33268, partial [Reticulomyxa filosa]